MVIELDKLNKGLKFSIIKKKRKKSEQVKTASIAYSRTGQEYLAANIFSDSNLLSVSSEQVVLVLAVHHNDFQVNEIVTLVEEPNPQQLVSPLILKIIIDHQTRTGTKINYTIVNKKGKVLFETKKINQLMPFYNPPLKKLSKVKQAQVSENYSVVNQPRDIKSVLKEYALLGIERNFPTYNSASGYGTAILTDKSNLYFGGQYGSFDKRIGLHSEMAVSISVLMSNQRERITHLGLVSSKYTDEPCEICGCCRQFLSELIQKFNYQIDFFCFAKDNNLFKKYSINQLLPGQWSSKKW